MQAVNQAEETMLFRSMKTREQLHEERAAVSQKIAAAVSKVKVKLKKSDEQALDLKQKVSQEKNISLPSPASPTRLSWPNNRPSMLLYGRLHGVSKKSIGT